MHVPRDASWLSGWMDELLAFPNGRHDDQVDSTSQALDVLSGIAFQLHGDEYDIPRPKDPPRPKGTPRRRRYSGRGINAPELR